MLVLGPMLGFVSCARLSYLQPVGGWPPPPYSLAVLLLPNGARSGSEARMRTYTKTQRTSHFEKGYWGALS